MDNNTLILEKLDNNILELEDININDIDLFSYRKDKTFIGYAFVKKTQTNKDNIYIKIFDQYQSNGYGNELFKEILNVLKKRNFKNVILTVDKNNYRIINIIKKNNGIELTTIKDKKEFIVRF